MTTATKIAIKNERVGVASAIIQLRGSFGESQQRFSDRLKVSLAAVSRWEMCYRAPSLDNLCNMRDLAANQSLPALRRVFVERIEQIERKRGTRK